ncbi:MAG: HRDC domain-containing protein [Planctomycetota bacterium]
MPTSDHPYVYIDHDEALIALANEMEGHERVGLDTEADSLHHYYEKVCLIQLSLGEDNYIIDPLADMDLAPFLSRLSQKRIVLHGSDYDLRILRSDFGFKPENGIFDTMLAAQILGHEQLGLAALVKQYFDMTLTKQGQKFNWSMRPLPESQLVYASDDTRYLLPMADRMIQGMQALGREGWHQESCDALIQYTRTDRAPPDPDQIWKIKGLKTFSRKELVFVRSLWHWREKEAQQSNTPAFKILGNAFLLNLASCAAAYPDDWLENCPKLPRTCRGNRFEKLKQAVAEAKNLPKDEWPKLRKKAYVPLTDLELNQINMLRKACSKMADRLKITPSVIASRASIEAIVKTMPRNLDEVMENGRMTRWQAELLMEEIQKVLSTPESE